MTDILKRLAAPFRPDQIDWRIGATNKDKTKGMALAYVDSRAVMHRLDEVCGHAWQCDYVPMPNGTYCCRIGIKIGDEWLWRSNGAINLPDSDKADAKEMAVKGSYSDAFKRAAVLWGVGQYLYDIDSPWVDIVPKGASHVFADNVRAKLDRMLSAGRPSNGTICEASPPQQTMAGRKNEADGIQRAREWANNAHKTLAGFDTPLGLKMWIEKNSATVDKLKAVVPEEFEALEAKINAAAERLNVLAAG